MNQNHEEGFEECYVCYESTWIRGGCGHYICFNCLRSGYDGFMKNGCGICRDDITNLLQCDVEVNKQLFKLLEGDYKVKIELYTEDQWHICPECKCSKHSKKYNYCNSDCTDGHASCNCLCSGLEHLYIFNEIGLARYFLRELNNRKNIITFTINSGDLSTRFEGIIRRVISYKCCGKSYSHLEFKICYSCDNFQPHINVENICLKCTGDI